ncbi:MAG: hypothetical protein DAHOPDDO_00468 [Ignavibacteriaceae bacterium]|jgi:O-antigen ligase|nr:MAG: hypothetical protein EDM72_12725 [Chlorobiota bacterium]MBL1124458.1 hypothetical protein [Ignavibacteriota bacterium]MBV6419252.1 hypothetical protein [Ignavibacteriaceae bacterium]MCE7857963.1 hypothetical protein [Ignavibacteria bacterium CHB3]NUM63304.1 O-antigen ligase family protein [Ignavibacteriaceae bacterium]
MALTVLRMFREMYWLYYATQLTLLLFILIIVKELWQKKLVLNKKTIQMFGIVILFPVWTALTAFWSLNPLTTFLKGVNFVFVVTGLFSALLLWVNYEDGNFFKLFLPANLLVVLTSIFSWLTGIPNDAWDIGHGLSFAGFFGHQNVMGMALMFTLPGVFGLLEDKKINLNNDNKSTIIFEGESTAKTKISNQKYFFFLILSLNLFLIGITYTRSVILSLFIGVIFYLFIAKAIKLLIGIGGLLTLVAILYFTITPVNQAIYKVASKHGWDILATRSILWEPSYEAAKIGGVLGIGYGMSAPGIYVYGPEDLMKGQPNYYREKGNSALAYIEETGLIGLILVFYFFSLWFYKLFKFRENISIQILLSFTFAFIIQSNFEGWVGGGSPLLQLFIPVIIYPMLIMVNRSILLKSSVN